MARLGLLAHHQESCGAHSIAAIFIPRVLAGVVYSVFCTCTLLIQSHRPQASLIEKSAFNNSFYYQLMQCSMAVRQWQLGSSKMQTHAQESQRPSFHTFIKNPIERHNSDKIPAAVRCAPCWTPASASKRFIQRFVILEKAPTRAFSSLKAATTAFTFKTLLRHYAKQTLTPRSLNVNLGP